MHNIYQALLIVSFGGPESREEVMPFLENVTRGKPVPKARLLEVAEHYYHFDGKSPINAQNRALKAALEKAFAQKNINLPIFLGNRNANPFIVDSLKDMQSHGVQRALGFFTASMSSYSGCRQYRENIAEAQSTIGETAPHIDKIRAFFNHPLYLETIAERIEECLTENTMTAADSHFIFTTHAIPESMAKHCDYEKQFHESVRLVAHLRNISEEQFTIAYQSRSGAPHIPWLGPDVNDVVRTFARKNIKNLIFIPIGFISDHMEVLYDLDVEAQDTTKKFGLQYARTKTAGTHPLFIDMICELVLERLNPNLPRRAMGTLGARADVCPPDCCQKA